MKRLASLILIIFSIGIFYAYINPHYKKIKELRVEKAQYENVLDKAKELRQVREELATTLASFKKSDLEKLEKFIPLEVNIARLINDIDALASKQGIKIKTIKTEEKAGAKDTNYKLVELNFAADMPYQKLAVFIRDLEDSLRMIDVVKVSIKTDETGNIKNNLTLRTYWLK